MNGFPSTTQKIHLIFPTIYQYMYMQVDVPVHVIYIYIPLVNILELRYEILIYIAL